jgi:hypothetical protein
VPQSQTMQHPLRWPLVSRLQTRTANLPLTKDARLINCYSEFDQEDNAHWIYKRVGLGSSTYISLPAGTGQGMYTESGTQNIYTVTGGNLYINTQTMPYLAVDATAPYVFETLGPATPTTSRQVVFGNGAAAYYIILDAGPPFHQQVAQQITDPNFPTTFAPGWCYLDGYLYVMDLNGTIWGASDIYSASTWSALNFIQAGNSADYGVALSRQLNYLIAMKQYSTQVFYDAGNPSPGSPLAPVPDAQIPLGCLHAYSVQSIDNSLLWLTANQTTSPQVVQMDNLVPKIVSTPDVDRVLNEITWSSKAFGVRSWVLKLAGHRFYGLTILDLNITLVYDLDQKQWYIWTDTNGNYWPVVSMAFQYPGSNLPGQHYAQHISNGNVYPVDGTYNYPNDYGNLFPVDIYTPNFDAGVDRRKQLNMMRFNADQTDGSTLNVRFSDDDYQSWSNFRNVDLSRYRPKLTQCGTFRRRAYHFRHLCNVALRIKTVDLQLDIGTL